MMLRHAQPVRIGALIQHSIGQHGLGQTAEDYARVGALLDGLVHQINAAARAGAPQADIDRLLAARDRLADALVAAEEANEDVAWLAESTRNLQTQVSAFVGKPALPIILWTAGTLGLASIVAYWVLFKSKKKKSKKRRRKRS